jgi:3',5'-cyclic AMP phosphodiesterase CpdA
MSLLLHLSDLHLGNLGHDDDIGDYRKTETIPEQDRVTKERLLKTALKALRTLLTQRDEVLDAVVISGDITTCARADGFSKLGEILAALGDKLPDPGRIVVVPGNHDVQWGTGPGTAERYQRFIDGVRSQGYVTPLLDGVDYVADEPSGTNNPIVVGDDFMVFAVNSADMCGVLEPLPPDLDALVGKLATDKHISSDEADQLRELRMYDMPRIQPRQLTALGDLISAADPDDSHRVRIAVLHHQLAPVREEEEVKPFESIINLGSFTAFLADSRTDMVLHGHKHADSVQSISIGSSANQRNIVVSSCGTIGQEVGTGHEIAKLIRIKSDLPHLRGIEVRSIPALGPGQTSLRDRIQSVYRGRTSSHPALTKVTVVGGPTTSDVHEQILALVDDPDRPSRDLICVVDDGDTANDPPSTYLWPADAVDPLPEWFAETVDWWQDPSPGDRKPFTHGRRLHTWPGSGGATIDQIAAISTLLAADPSTSRGVAVLVNPSEDDITDKTRSFPSFSLLHLWIEDDRLHCSAFFRKQEMTYWWAVNVAEIASIQTDLLHDLHGGNPDLKPGSIRTHTSEAVFSDRVPKVDVPRIDRLFWKGPDQVRVLAVAIADEGAENRSTDVSEFLRLLDDWEPEAEEPPADGAPVPGPGLAAIANILSELETRYPSSPAKAVAEVLRDLDEQNRIYLEARDGANARAAYKKWRGKVRPKLTKVRELLALE